MATIAAPKTKTDLALELGRSMAELRNHLRQYIQERIREQNMGVTFEMLEVMSVLWKKDGVNQQDIADRSFRDKSSMTYLIDNLVKRDLVKRSEDESDRRANLIFLTGQGKALREQMQPWLAEIYERATVNMDTTDIHQALYALNKMISNLSKP